MSARVKRAKFLDPLDVASVEQDWHQRGYSCQRFEDPPGQVWRDFVHSTNEVVMVSKGRLEVEIDGEVFLANPGDEVFIPRDTTHTVANAADGRTVWLLGYG